MNKNTIIGSILMAVIIIVWMTMNASNEEARAKARAAQADAQKAAAAQVAEANSPSELVLPVNKPEAKEPPVLGAAPQNAAAEVAESATVDSANVAADSSAAEVKAPAIVPRTVTVETEKFIMTLSNKGGKVQSVIVKALKDSTGNYPELIQDTARGALDLKLGGADLSEALFAVDAPEWITVDADTSVQFTFTDANGNKVVRSYGFTKDGAAVRQVNKFVGFNPTAYELSWNGGMKETEVIPKGKTFGAAGYFFSEVIYRNNDITERESFSDAMTLDDANYYWVGLRRKYVAMSVQFDKPVPAKVKAKHVDVPVEGKTDPGTYTLSIADEVRADSVAYNFMVLPLKWLKFFYSIIPNYGVAIILITIIVRAFTTPFTIKQMKSTRAMAALKPQMDEINVKYRSDPQKKQAAMMELYSKNNVSPFSGCSGCLPMLFQMPIFMGLFFVLGRAIELRGMPAFLWITDLSKSDVVWSGISIPYIMPAGLAILPWIMVVTTYFQTKVTMSGSAGMDPAQQKMMVWMMPAMMFFFSAVMPSGLVFYWIISNIWTIVQYKIMYKNVAPAKASGKLNGKKVQDAKIVK